MTTYDDDERKPDDGNGTFGDGTPDDTVPAEPDKDDEAKDEKDDEGEEPDTAYLPGAEDN